MVELQKFSRPLRAAVLAALVVGTATYLAENSYAVTAGLLVTIPVSLPAIWFIQRDRKALKEYTWSFLLGFIIYFLSLSLFYYLLSKRNYDKKKAILTSMFFWFVGILFVYFIVLENN